MKRITEGSSLDFLGKVKLLGCARFVTLSEIGPRGTRTIHGPRIVFGVHGPAFPLSSWAHGIKDVAHLEVSVDLPASSEKLLAHE